MLRNCHETLQKLVVVPLLFRRGGTVPLLLFRRGGTVPLLLFRRGGTVPLAEQFHFCFLEGGGFWVKFGYATELLMLKLLYRVYTFKWPKKENFGYFSLD